MAADLVYLWWDTVYSIIQHVRSVSGYVPQVYNIEKSCFSLGNILVANSNHKTKYYTHLWYFVSVTNSLE